MLRFVSQPCRSQKENILCTYFGRHFASRTDNNLAGSGIPWSAKESRLVQVRHVKHQTKAGKVGTFSALVVAGNKAGGIGFAVGKNKAVGVAVAEATKLAEARMEYFERYEQRTLFHDIEVKFKATKLILRAAPAETGRRVHWAIQEMCRCMGIHDLSGKVYGSRHPANVVQAFMIALRRQKTPQQVALDSGMKLVDVLKVYQFGKESCSRPPSDARQPEI